MAAPHLLTPTKVPDELAVALREGRVVASVGAGFSRAAGLPDWESLLQGIIDDCGLATQIEIPANFCSIPYSERDTLQSAIVEKAGRTRACASMDRQLHAVGASAEMDRRLAALFALPVVGVITWNWDDVLCSHCAVVGGGEPPDGQCERDFFLPAANRTPPLPLLKLQGSFANPASVVMEQADYERVKPARDAFLRRLYVDGDYVVLHMGQGLGGLSGGVVGPVLVEQPLRHFALVSDDADTPEEELLRDRGVGVLRYSTAAGHTEGICALLAAFAPAAGSGG